MSQSLPTSSSSLQTLDAILNEILLPHISNPHLATSLRNIAKRGENGEYLLAGTLLQAGGSGTDGSVAPGMTVGADPLTLLDPYVNTLGYLYILTARLIIQNPLPVTLAVVESFCQSFNPEVARLVPERVTLLAQLIVKITEAENNLSSAIGPLETLLRRYTPSLDYLTTIHSQFVHACVATRNYAAALPILQFSISEIDTRLSPLSYHDVLNYHYIGALALLGLRNYQLASKYLELVVSAPTQSHPSALQLEALKKLTIVRLILYGATRPLPRYSNPNLSRLIKSTPYASFPRVFPSTPDVLQEIVDKDLKVFQTDCNMGLVRQLLEYGPRWAIRRLTATYITLSLKEIGKAVGVPDEQIVRDIVLSMIERSEIKAELNGNTVVFLDDDLAEAGLDSQSFSPKEIEKLLKSTQAQSALLAELDREVARSKEFLIRALKDKEVSAGVLIDEELFNIDGAGHGMKDWDD
ncbi:hypothetical protein Clacol_004534 [Clathrus columnatus]|uniref:COP9 signalosome complex subunit 3 N-terminal helical repeats domain-containing protein n=1 Tax=Clathrus columnatus TaxID=1419009 RepID=A0AAV5AA07_9AGAM|nr:hypothetical protein Clacol_004534 [Clathrus columnatus]